MSAGMIILGLIVGIIILLVLVTIHEFAHFIVAKIFGAYVYEFTVGFGPKIFEWGKKETKYSIRIIPFGGYVYIASELTDPPKNRKDEIVANERKMENIKRWKRLIFIVSGALMNFIIALFIFTISFINVGYAPRDITYWGENYVQNKTAHKALSTKSNQYQQAVILDYWLGDNKKALQIASEYYQINGHDDPNFKGISSHIGKINYIPNYLTTVTNFIVNLKKQFNYDKGNNSYIIFNFVIVDKYKQVIKNTMLTNVIKLENKTSSTYQIGISPPTRIFTSIWEEYIYGWKKTFTESIKILKSFGSLFTSHWSQLSGPIGIAKTMSSILTEGVLSFFLYVAMLSANLFVLNLIPIPPLDGYKFIETVIEIIGNGILRLKRKLKIKKNKNNTEVLIETSTNSTQDWCLSYKWKIVVNTIGILLFILLFIFITIKDIFF